MKPTYTTTLCTGEAIRPYIDDEFFLGTPHSVLSTFTQDFFKVFMNYRDMSLHLELNL